MRCENLCLKYDDKLVIENLNIEFPKKCCIMGVSGRGKSTILKIAAGLKTPFSGRIVSEYKKPAVMFQDDRLLPWLTALENIEIVCDDRDTAKEYLRAVELEAEADKYPDELSGGMKRRIALARALAYKGDILILDEAFNGLDEALRNRMIELVKSSGLDFLIATHSEEEAMLLNSQVIRI